MRRAARAHVLDLRREDLSRVAMHEIGVALASDEVLRRRRLAACVKRWPRLLDRLGVEAGVLDLVVAAGERVLGSRPHPLQDADELSRSRVPLVVFHPCAAVLVALLLPPGAHHVEGEAAARDVIDGGGFLRDQGRKPEVGPDRGHELETLGQRRQRSGGRPGLETVGLGPLDVVQVQLGDEGHIPPGGLGALREFPLVCERRGHVLVLDVPQPPTEHRHPETEAHRVRLPADRRPRSAQLR